MPIATREATALIDTVTSQPTARLLWLNPGLVQPGVPK